MNHQLTKTPWGSYYTGKLSRGCQQCITGEKLVVLVSTECSSNCFYCPLSIERKSSPYAYANERPILNLNDIKEEASQMDACGASMTGGDPTESHSFLRTMEYCRFLKNTFSDDFHIHLYTRGKEFSPKILSKLTPYVDEIRFHVINLKKDFTQVKLALKSEIDVGIEVPVIPTKGIDYYSKLIAKFASILPKNDRFHFVNLNELEVAETNFRNLLAHNLKIKLDNESAIEGSSSLGREIVAWASKKSEVPVHFCNLATKDSIQLPNRLYRIANNIQLPSDVVISDGPDRGLLIRGVIQSKSRDLNYIRQILITKLQIPENLLSIDNERNQLLTNAALLEEMKERIRSLFPDIILGIIEEYPTYDRLQTTFIPL
jgi:pyruvate formate-lyase activating enzyme-like uncharacterized protein